MPGFPWLDCRSPLVFNRNTGTCDHETNAPCDSEVVNDPSCPSNFTGFIQGRLCFIKILCWEGTQVGGEMECATGWAFDKVKQDCIPDPDGTCVRPGLDFMVPRVKNGVGRKQSRKQINIQIEGL